MKYEELRKHNPFNPVTELKAYRDWFNTLDYAYEQGVKIGLKEIITKMKKANLDVNLIAETTGFSKEEIEKL